MSGYKDHNYPVFIKAKEMMESLGWSVESPAHLGPVQGWGWADYILRDLKIFVSRCKAICLLPEFWVSEGAKIELIFAKKMGLPIFKLDHPDLYGTPDPSDGSYSDDEYANLVKITSNL